MTRWQIVRCPGSYKWRDYGYGEVCRDCGVALGENQP